MREDLNLFEGLLGLSGLVEVFWGSKGSHHGTEILQEMPGKVGEPQKLLVQPKRSGVRQVYQSFDFVRGLRYQKSQEGDR